MEQHQQGRLGIAGRCRRSIEEVLAGLAGGAERLTCHFVLLDSGYGQHEQQQQRSKEHEGLRDQIDAEL